MICDLREFMGIIISNMAQYDIEKNLALFESIKPDIKNERILRNMSEQLYIASVNENRAYVLDKIRIKIRQLDNISPDCESSNNYEINLLLEELCLGADFCIMQKNKRVMLSCLGENIVVKLNLRRFENLFYYLLSRLLTENDCVKIRCERSFGFVTVKLTSDNMPDILFENMPESIVAVYEKDRCTLAFKLKAYNGPLPFEKEPDFSNMLFDKMSALNKWFCDI